MLSYALGTIKIENFEEKDYYDSKFFREDGFIKNKEVSVSRELEKYGNVRPDLLRRLTNVMIKNNFNVAALVAADHWFRGNNKPKIFLPEMFTTSNVPFLNISSISYENKKIWNKDAFTTLITYAKYLRDNVYLQSDDIKVVDKESDEDDIYDYEEAEIDIDD